MKGFTTTFKQLPSCRRGRCRIDLIINMSANHSIYLWYWNFCTGKLLAKYTEEAISLVSSFPALISWLCATPSKEDIRTLISNPLSAMSREVKAMKESTDKQERGMYLILAYMALHGGLLEVNDMDTNLFGELRKKFELDYDIIRIKKDVEMMVMNHFLLKTNDNYELNLNIMKKIVFVSETEYDVVFVQNHCKKDHYLRHIIRKDEFKRGNRTRLFRMFL